MAAMNQRWKRRIRIEGKPDEMLGFMIQVFDAESGEMVTNITKLVVTLSVEGENTAEVTYYEKKADGVGFVLDTHHDPVQQTITVPDPEISVTAYEVDPQDGADGNE